MTDLPSGVPVLGSGRHRSPAHGACFMEYASVLGGAPWSDDPKVTHPVLALIARHVNDRTSDEGRWRLVHLVPLVITGHCTDRVTGQRLVRRLVLRALAVSGELRRRTLYVALLTADSACGDRDDADRRAVSLLLADPEDDLRAAIAFRNEHTRGRSGRRTPRDERRAAEAAIAIAVAAVAAQGGARADALLHDLLADAIELVRGEERPEPAREVVPTSPIGG